MDKRFDFNDTAIGRWVLVNKDSPNFFEDLQSLVSYACAEWIRHSSGKVLSPKESLSRIVLSLGSDIPLGLWMSKPENYLKEIVLFCEKIKTELLPKNMDLEHVSLLDLRGVGCPMNAVRSRLIMKGLPYGHVLEIWLDEGPSIENVPRALSLDGVKVIFRKKNDNYWVLKVVKTTNNV